MTKAVAYNVRQLNLSVVMLQTSNESVCYLTLDWIFLESHNGNIKIHWSVVQDYLKLPTKII